MRLYLRAASMAIGPFADRVAERLFQVDVLAGAAGGDHRQHVPLLVGGDDDRVDVLVLEQLAVVAVGGDAVAAGEFAALSEVLGVHVADGGESSSGQAEESGNEQAAAARAAADQAQIDGVVGAGGCHCARCREELPAGCHFTHATHLPRRCRFRGLAYKVRPSLDANNRV